MVFTSQPAAGTLEAGQKELEYPRAPYIYNLRTDPFERATITSNTYSDCLLNHSFFARPAREIVGRFLATFREYPPRQRAASFTIQQILEKLGQPGGDRSDMKMRRSFKRPFRWQEMTMHISAILVGLVLSSVISTNARAQQQSIGGRDSENLQSMLSAQIRMQGYACDRPLAAKRDARRSRPDLGVWVLKCSNATYRVRRAPDMPATVERLKMHRLK